MPCLEYEWGFLTQVIERHLCVWGCWLCLNIIVLQIVKLDGYYLTATAHTLFKFCQLSFTDCMWVHSTLAH